MLDFGLFRLYTEKKEKYMDLHGLSWAYIHNRRDKEYLPNYIGRDVDYLVENNSERYMDMEIIATSLKESISNEIKKTEQEIEVADQRIQQLEEQFLDPAIATNSLKLQELQKEYEQLKEKPEQLFNRWEELSLEESSW